MLSRRRVIQAGVALFPAALLVFAYSTGPDPRHTAAPGDDPLACATAGCHNGTALNGGGGNVAATFPTGLTYTPGVAQTLTIAITDSAAKIYGFQMSARPESNLTNGQAGDFTAGVQQIVICDNSDLKPAKGCAANAPVQFIEHNFPYRSNSIPVLWTPPATNVGNVRIYVAANAANSDGNNTGDHIYTASYVLAPQAALGTPAIASVASAGAFNASAGLASGTWLEIYGTNLSATTRSWAGDDFNGANAPTKLDNVSVTINGVAAYVDFVSSGQVNVQAPDDATTGSGIQIVLTNPGGRSNSISMAKSSIAPALLAPGAFNVSGHQWAVAQFTDQTFVGKPGLISGLNFRAAKAGDLITIYGIGFGPVTPATGAGVVASGITALQTAPTFRFGQTQATLSYAGLAPGAVGLYQFNIVVPNVTPGDMALNVDVGGASLNQNLFITVSQ